jgi:hypothetical protein
MTFAPHNVDEIKSVRREGGAGGAEDNGPGTLSRSVRADAAQSLLALNRSESFRDGFE